jgi:hypothetical protein
MNGGYKHSYRILVRKLAGKKTTWKTKCRQRNNIKMVLNRVSYEMGSTGLEKSSMASCFERDNETVGLLNCG